MPAGYSKRSLVDKLGIKPNSRAAIVHPPAGYDATLAPLPPGGIASSNPTSELDFVQAFYTESSKLDRDFPRLKKSIKQAGVLWVSWPKKASRMETDLTDEVVRGIGLKHGLVDIKVCGVDEVWSGWKFMDRLQ